MATRRGNQGFARSDRVAEQVRRELAELLRFGVKDPRLAKLLPLVTLTDVEVTPDYAHAKVFYTSLSDQSTHRELEEGLARIGGYLRKELGKRIRLHQTPALHFKFDASVSHGAELSRLIDQTVAADNAAHAADQTNDAADPPHD